NYASSDSAFFVSLDTNVNGDFKTTPQLGDADYALILRVRNASTLRTFMELDGGTTPARTPDGVETSEEALTAYTTLLGFNNAINGTPAGTRVEQLGTSPPPGSTDTSSLSVFNQPPNAPALGSASLINTADTRATSAVFVGDGSLWTTHTVGGITGANAGESVVRWYEFRVDANSPTQLAFTTEPILRQQAEIFDDTIDPNFDPLADDGVVFSYAPGIAVNQFGDMLLSYAASGPRTFIGAYFTGRGVGDPINTTVRVDVANGVGVLLEGQDSYNILYDTASLNPQFDSSAKTFFSRVWGLTSGVAIDPALNVNGRFWLFNAYADLIGDGGDETNTIPAGRGSGNWETLWGAANLRGDPGILTPNPPPGTPPGPVFPPPPTRRTPPTITGFGQNAIFVLDVSDSLQKIKNRDYNADGVIGDLDDPNGDDVLGTLIDAQINILLQSLYNQPAGTVLPSNVSIVIYAGNAVTLDLRPQHGSQAFTGLTRDRDGDGVFDFVQTLRTIRQGSGGDFSTGEVDATKTFYASAVNAARSLVRQRRRIDPNTSTSIHIFSDGSGSTRNIDALLSNLRPIDTVLIGPYQEVDPRTGLEDPLTRDFIRLSKEPADRVSFNEPAVSIRDGGFQPSIVFTDRDPDQIVVDPPQTNPTVIDPTTPSPVVNSREAKRKAVALDEKSDEGIEWWDELDAVKRGRTGRS
ncbi:MAG: hypothetical protein ACRC1K_18695, partial [Planctomycetia bacterium]